MFEFKKEDRLGIISMNKAPANSYDIHFFNEFEKILNTIEVDSDIAVVLLKSAIPKFFSAGADIKVFQSNTAEQNKEMVVMANKIANQISKSSKIFVAFLNGHTLGGGLELALACDIRLSSNKKFLLGLPEVKLGLMPGNGGIPRLVNAVGISKAFELVVSGNNMDSQEAYRNGLVNQLFDEEKSEEQAFEYAVNLSKGPKKAMAAIKQTFSDGIGKSLGDFLKLEKEKVNTLYDTYDAKEGFLAFVEKRTPEFE
ncbi:enoyl-CoA hydratase/isomerase family protein [Seonamhaeicola maritimus]|uniref:Enoyl-CoA hydratase/isomerase family protein n=1 Tax=Seonamhaeicola maritimus TaxID=2591822 RepID=A0A5C7GL90_9FLAO|nr:enoyl-CoA hydratase/isomerase family protein [Seonamhaeicola maritimus]TXG39256.1 enoyl-CoA hydratase/isomerase family protein [Seonamhaeicola maritimus]